MTIKNNEYCRYDNKTITINILGGDDNSSDVKFRGCLWVVMMYYSIVSKVSKLSSMRDS
jgi:hypothetical protein